ncbi:MAG: MATE family efflux transporter [Pseudomonadota bacterium]
MAFATQRLEMLRILRLAIPLIIANVAMLGMEVVDTAMAGQVSAIDLAGLAVGANIWLMCEMALGGIMTAVMPRVAHFRGAGEPGEITHEVQQGILMGVSIGVLLNVILLALVPYIPLIGAEPEVTEIAQKYTTIIAFSLPISAVIWVVFGMAEGHEMTDFAVASSLVALTLNAIFDYIFVFGKLGFPQMGGVGCAITTTVIYWLWGASCLIYAHRNKVLKSYHILTRWPGIDLKRWGAILALGLPIGTSLLAEEGFFSFSTLLIAPLGAVTLGAHQVTFQIVALALMLSLGVGQATAIRAANSLGRKEFDHARLQVFCGLAIVIGISLSLGAVTHFGNMTIPKLFSNDNTIVLLSGSLLLFAPIFLLFDAMLVWAAQTLRGFQDTKVPMMFQISAYWFIGFPLGYTLGRTELWGKSYGIYGFWGGLFCGIALCSMLMAIRLVIKTRPQQS